MHIRGAKTSCGPEEAAVQGQVVDVDAKGPWSLAIEHRVPQKCASWAHGKPVETWLPSTHRGTITEHGFELGSEDTR